MKGSWAWGALDLALWCEAGMGTSMKACLKGSGGFCLFTPRCHTSIPVAEVVKVYGSGEERALKVINLIPKA